MTGIQAIAFVLLVGLAVIGALEVDRRIASCNATVHFARTTP